MHLHRWILVQLLEHSRSCLWQASTATLATGTFRSLLTSYRCCEPLVACFPRNQLMLSRIHVVSLGLMCFGISVQAEDALSASEADLLRQFNNACKSEWSAYQDGLSGINVATLQQSTRAEKKPTEETLAGETYTVEEVVDGGRFVTMEQMSGRDLSGAPEETRAFYNASIVNAYNGDYGFTVMDKDRNETWTIQSVQRDPPTKGRQFFWDDGFLLLPGVEVPVFLLAPTEPYAKPISA